MKYLQSANKGNLRLWLIFASAWVAFSSYYFGYKEYQANYKSNSEIICKDLNVTGVGMFTMTHPIYTNVKDLSFSTKYNCSYSIEMGRQGKYVALEPRYITFGTFLIIITPPFSIPLLLLIFNWVRDGYQDSE